MINKNDELLNKYIDNDFNSQELEEINSALQLDPNLVKHLKAYKVVDQSLKAIEVEKAPDEITDKVMKLVFASVKNVKPKARAFIASVSSIFALIIIVTFSFAVSMIPKNMKTVDVTPITNSVKQQLNSALGTVNQFFSNSTVMIIGAFISLLLLTFVYYTLESHKNFKNKLNSALKH